MISFKIIEDQYKKDELSNSVMCDLSMLAHFS